MFCVKVHQSYRTVVAICDSELIGKKFEEGIKQLDIRESFYKKEEVSEEEIASIMEKQKFEDATFNIVGKESVRLAIENGIITSDATSSVSGIPFALKLI
jgi:hypothetical protein